MDTIYNFKFRFKIKAASYYLKKEDKRYETFVLKNVNVFDQTKLISKFNFVEI